MAAETIREMARLSLLTNKLNDIQIKNLEMYPFVFFNGVSAIKIDYNFHNNIDVSSTEDKEAVTIDYNIQKPETSHFRISYYLTIDESIDNINIDKRFETIENSVRNILWKQISVEVYFNNVLKFKSK